MPSTTLSNLFTTTSSSGQLQLHLPLINITACFLIGLSSMLSLFVFNLVIHRRNPFTRDVTTSNGHTPNHHPSPLVNDPSKSEILKSVLSFAVGGLLGDVFLHLLPEASVQLTKLGYGTLDAQQYLGVWILSGLIFFVVFETIFVQLQGDAGAKEEEEVEPVIEYERIQSNGTAVANGLKHRKQNGTTAIHQNGKVQQDSPPIPSTSPINVTGYLNLLANGFDNFTHGMSVGASFLVSFKMGCLTTLAIAIHEIPHEIVDYVILLRSGFSCWNAFRAQLSISLVTILGSLTVLYFDSSSEPLSYTLWILPFTAGGFIYIALTSLLPELLSFEAVSAPQKTATKVANTSEALANSKRLLQRIFFLLGGIGTMAAVNVIDIF